MGEVKRREGLYGFEYLEKDKRRVDLSKRKTYSIKQLWQRSHEIINLAAQGYKNTEIAMILNITPETVSNILNSELGELKLSEVRYGRDEEAKRTTERIRVLTDRALDVYDEIFNCEEEQLSIKDKGDFARSFVKDISGLRAPLRVESASLHVSLTKEKLDEIKARGKDAMREAGLLGND